MDEGKRREWKYDCWLCHVPGIGDKTIGKLKEICPDAEGIYRGGERLWRRVLSARQLESIQDFARKTDPDGAVEDMERKGITFVTAEDEAYPGRLRVIPDPPYGLFFKGSLPEEEVLSVAVVGARECSGYGEFVAGGIGRVMGESGVQVISGMARGIDGISQSAALDAGGSSFGVLGSGVDICYPSSNRELYERLCGEREETGGCGGVLSVYPPGTAARPQNFPPRNRIVSGLADVLIVVEARAKSGTLITVDMALEQGKEVYVVPGRVTDRLSDGCNRLIKQGAAVFLSPEDLLREITDDRMGTRRRRKAEEQDGQQCGMTLSIPQGAARLEPELRQVYDVLDLQPRSIATIGEILRKRTGEETDERQLTVRLIRLCMEGLAVQVSPGSFARFSE